MTEPVASDVVMGDSSNSREPIAESGAPCVEGPSGRTIAIDLDRGRRPTAAERIGESRADRRWSPAYARAVPLPRLPDDPADPTGHDEHRAETRLRYERTPPTWGRVRVRRTADDHRWWPMPLWLWAVVIAVLTVLAILVVGALGGHWAVVGSIMHDTGRHACPDGFPTRDLVTERPDGGCMPWQQMYVIGGIGVFAMLAIYRWTIERRVRSRWPRR
jgi:hypothetical protein